MGEQEFSTTDAAKYLEITRQSMLALARRHNLGRRIGHGWVFTKTELDAWLAMPRTRRPPKRDGLSTTRPIIQVGRPVAN